MENISIQSYSAQLRIYSRSADPPKPKLPDTSSGTSSEASSRSCDFQSKDGDTFSMSLEARIVQISMSRSDDGAQLGQGADDSQGSGALGSDSQSGGTSKNGLLKTLMQALGGFLGNDGAGATDTVEALEPGSARGQGPKHPHRHHPMGNPEDVASKVLQHLQQEHAEKGGSLQAFVDQIQKRMENRREAGSGKTDGSSDFRAQVDSLITSGLTAWAQTGGETALNQT
jgi:hypothetical protein